MGEIERWLPVVGFPLYDVSDFGRVRSWAVRFKPPGTRAAEPRLVALSPAGRCGHLTVGFGSNPQVRKGVHVVVLSTFVGPCPVGMECRHLDGDPTNNRLDNLAWGTPLQNQHDRRRHGTAGRKLKEKQVLEIKERLAAGETVKELVAEYGVSPTTINNIRHGVIWSYLND